MDHGGLFHIEHLLVFGGIPEAFLYVLNEGRRLARSRRNAID